MTFLSVKDDGRSVAIACARISTACPSKPCFFTKSSLAKMAAALPSDVGLKSNNQIIKNVMNKEIERADTKMAN